MYGIKSVSDQWLDEATDVLYKYSFQPNSHIFRKLYIHPLVASRASQTKGKHYSVILFDNFTGNVTNVNNLIIEFGYAVNISGENINIDFKLFKEMGENKMEAIGKVIF